MKYRNTIVWHWAHDTQPSSAPGNAYFNAVLSHVRALVGGPAVFPNAAYMEHYLSQTGLPSMPPTAYAMAWQSYYAYHQRYKNAEAPLPLSEEMGTPASAAEARRLGINHYDNGVLCRRDPTHGSRRRTNNNQCVQCFRVYHKKYVRSTKQEIELPPITEAERVALAALLVKTPNRRAG